MSNDKMKLHVSANDDRRNRRVETRFPTLKRGLIVFHNGNSTFDCAVRNISTRGALLLFGEAVGVPNHFDLAMQPSHYRRPCTVRWRNGTTVGLSFDTRH